MISSLLYLLISSFFVDNITSQSVTLNGAYQGKNLYIQNPFTANMKDFCTDEVYVNEVKIMDNIKSSAYEIDLSGYAVSTPISVKIVHKDDCKPKVLNAQVIRSSSTFQFMTAEVDKGELMWSTKGEKQGERVVVEQFLYNNWIPIKDLSSKGSNLNNYAFEGNHHSGLNKYRIKYQEKDGNIFYSKVIEYESTIPQVTFFPKRVANKIYLSRSADYEVIDGYGNVISKGKGKEIVCDKLEEGVYYLNIDNKTEKFLKK